MFTISIQEIQQDLLGFLRRVESGQALVILRGDQPVAEIKPVTPKDSARRPFGLCAGEFTVPNDFDEPLPDSILDAFEGR